MPRAIHEDLRWCMIGWRDEGYSIADIANLAACHERTVYRVLGYYNAYGTVLPPYFRSRGRPRDLTQPDINYVLSYFEANPAGYLEEAQADLYEGRGNYVSLASLSRALNHIDFTKKTLRKVAAQRDEDERALFHVQMAEYTDPELFIFLDESSVDGEVVRRTHGWNWEGHRAVRREVLINSERHSILPALTVDGILALRIIPGSVTKELFIQFLREELVCFLHSIRFCCITDR